MDKKKRERSNPIEKIEYVHIDSVASALRERPTRFRKRAKIRSEGRKNVGTDERFARW